MRVTWNSNFSKQTRSSTTDNVELVEGVEAGLTEAGPEDEILTDIGCRADCAGVIILEDEEESRFALPRFLKLYKLAVAPSVELASCLPLNAKLLLTPR